MSNITMMQQEQTDAIVQLQEDLAAVLSRLDALEAASQTQQALLEVEPPQNEKAPQS